MVENAVGLLTSHEGADIAAKAQGHRHATAVIGDPALLIKLIKTEGVTFTHGVPTLLQMLLDAAVRANVDLAGLKMVIGGSALPKALPQRAMDRGVDVFAGYGMSETGPLLTVAHVKSGDLSGESDKEVEIRTRA